MSFHKINQVGHRATIWHEGLRKEKKKEYDLRSLEDLSREEEIQPE